MRSQLPVVETTPSEEDASGNAGVLSHTPQAAWDPYQR